MAARQDISGNRLDDAARAGWLYYVAGNNQEQIAQKMEEITRQLEEASRQASEHQAFRQDVLAKMQEISKLVAELQSPALKDAIRNATSSQK